VCTFGVKDTSAEGGDAMVKEKVIGE
jgi:hypothetical protein